MTNKRVLVVDDSKLNRKLVSTILLANGLEVLEADDGEMAVAMAGEELPDLILMDVQLPKIDGYEATRRVRADEKTKDVVIIALTAHAMAGEAQRAREAGCDGYISKPVDTRTLMDTLQPFLNSSIEK
ncbi:MAG: response regulator [Anaerolineales bacterium]|nr:response regulator [Anaerolineales bacterium]MCK5635651.1 response regulator [Anaerolineales bacterium]